MICEEIPPKQDSGSEATQQQQQEQQTQPESTTLNLEQQQTITEQQQSQDQQASTTDETETTAEKATPEAVRNNRQFILFLQQRNKLLREFWTLQQQRIKENRDGTQLITIILLSVIAIACSISAITTNFWLSDSLNNFGLWNTCFRPNVVTRATNDLQSNSSSSWTGLDQPLEIVSSDKVMCARQELGEVIIGYAEQARIDQVTAAQALITAGTILYALSIITNALACKFIRLNNLNSLRNVMVLSMFMQIVSFLMHLIGFFLFILTDHFSISVGLLFIYFGIAIFATNIINFITIEYKCYKYRQI